MKRLNDDLKFQSKNWNRGKCRSVVYALLCCVVLCSCANTNETGNNKKEDVLETVKIVNEEDASNKYTASMLNLDDAGMIRVSSGLINNEGNMCIKCEPILNQPEATYVYNNRKWSIVEDGANNSQLIEGRYEFINQSKGIISVFDQSLKKKLKLDISPYIKSSEDSAISTYSKGVVLFTERQIYKIDIEQKKLEIIKINLDEQMLIQYRKALLKKSIFVDNREDMFLLVREDKSSYIVSIEHNVHSNAIKGFKFVAPSKNLKQDKIETHIKGLGFMDDIAIERDGDIALYYRDDENNEDHYRVIKGDKIVKKNEKKKTRELCRFKIYNREKSLVVHDDQTNKSTSIFMDEICDVWKEFNANKNFYSCANDDKIYILQGNILGCIDYDKKQFSSFKLDNIYNDNSKYRVNLVCDKNNNLYIVKIPLEVEEDESSIWRIRI